MKLVKDLQKWIDGYNEVKTLADELELSFDFYKEELVTEGDVDAAYAKASEAVEALELKNMLRDEADQMACVLKINSGANGRAVAPPAMGLSGWYGKSGLGIYVDAYVSALC